MIGLFATWLRKLIILIKIKQANNLAIDGKTYHVYPEGRFRFLILNNDRVKIHNRKVGKSRRINMYNVRRFVVYSTDRGWNHAN